MNYHQLVGLGIATSTALIASGAAVYLTMKPEPYIKDLSILKNQSVILKDGSHVSSTAPIENYSWAYYSDVTTTLEVFQYGMKASGNGPCLGTRNGPNNSYKWLSYGEVYDMAQNFGSALVNMGLEAEETTHIGLYSINRFEWTLIDLACSMFSMASVPLYDTLNLTGCIYVISHAEVSTVVCDTEERIKNLLNNNEEMPVLKRIISLNKLSDDCFKMATDKGIELLHFSDVLTQGAENKKDIVPPNCDNIFSICYTSGTTGVPKGVIATHKNVLAEMSSILVYMKGHIDLSSNDRHLSYLPLAHMYERMIQQFVFIHGARIGFWRGEIPLMADDLQTLKPTFFFTVPRLINRFYDKISSAVKSSKLKSFLFHRAIASKKNELKNGIIRNNGFWDKIIFKKISQAFGGCLKVVVVSSAPLSPEVMTFMRCAVGCVVVEAYGASETSGACCANALGDTSEGNVGAPLPGSYIKLVDVPEMEYYSNNNQGEICVKGDVCTRGYYKNPEKTAELFNSDGWLLMGDIGEWLPNGALKIIGRKKDVFKLSQGEYIAVEKIENVYLRSEAVMQVFVTGNSLKDYPVAVVVPDPEYLTKWAASHQLKGTIDELCSNEEVKKHILSSMKQEGTRQNLCSFEQVKNIHLHSEAFSISDGFLTPTLKNKRPFLEKYFSENVAELYKTAI